MLIVPSDGQYELTCVGPSNILALDRPSGMDGLEISKSAEITGRFDFKKEDTLKIMLGHHVTVVVHMFIIHLSGGKTFWRCC